MLRGLVIAVVIIFAFFVVMGNYLGQQCINISECKYCWNPITSTVKSDLCPDPEKPCTASSDAQRYNAYVDAAICACEKAQTDEYTDPTLNTQIVDLVYGFSGYRYDEAKNFCDQPGSLAVKQTYG